MDLSCHIHSGTVRTINHADMRGAKVQVIARYFFEKNYIFQIYAFGKTKGNLCSEKSGSKTPILTILCDRAGQ